MKHIRLSAATFAASAIALTCLFPLQATAKDYTAINIFGDSLVDAGNFFNFTGLPPSPPYAQKLSNGPVWVEPLADELGLKPVLFSNLLSGEASPTDGVNFALAGSLSSGLNVGSPQLPGLQQQIGQFGAIAPSLPAAQDTLFVLLAGGNDYNEALFAPDSLTTALENLPNQVTDNLTAATDALIKLGAEHLLVANLPDLGAQPFADQLNLLDPQNAMRLTALSTEHNLLLDQKLSALSAASPAEITQLKLNELFDELLTDPAEFGFTNTTDACLTNFQPGFVFDGICDNPDEFVFWDNVHPTAAAHSEIAQFALATLNEKDGGEAPQSVPEPSILIGLLMLSGGIALGASKRTAVINR